ncbi:MAG: aminotransferase class I/II-fold pyridoxal phosphate-dependent enzyme [Candidatus Kariarchaeaceae archaeon]|jgi:8-amino-7-oxononanoate synthase
MPDLFQKADQYVEAKNVKRMGYYPYFLPASGSIGPRTTIEGQEVIMLGSNNYMGLTDHPELKNAAKEAIDKYGTGCTGSRFLNGTLDIHIELEKKLAEFTEKDDAIAFSTGFQTNLGVLSSITSRGDFVISDAYNHASIVDGCRLALSETRAYMHNDMTDLERVLKSIPKDAGKLIVSDGVFSMEGDLAKLPEISELAEQYDAKILIDDAHAVGYLGKRGEGTGGHFNMMDKVDIVVGTFSKSFASIGGFVSASEDVIHYIQHHARSLIFSASLPPPSVATALAAVNIFDSNEGDQKREQLMKNAKLLKNGLTEEGFNTGHSVTPIVPVIIGDPMNTFVFWKELFKAGVYTNPVRAPAVPPGMELLRTSVMATHNEEDIKEAISIFTYIGKEMDII